MLVAEFVPGGNIEDWMQETEHISEKQWKYVIFAMAWTLLVLQDRYRFMHNDFHDLNVLIDNSIDPNDKSYVSYELHDPKSLEPVVFNVQNVGIIPKMWDMEFANVYKNMDKMYKNEFMCDEEDIPNSFNPYYDLHRFLTSL